MGTKMDKDLEKVKDLLDKSDDKKDDGDDDDKFNDVMGVFYKESSQKVSKLQSDFSSTIKGVQDLAKFYGEKVKESQFKVEEFFGIFNEFRETFIENRDKIINIEKDKEKQRKKEEAKR